MINPPHGGIALMAAPGVIDLTSSLVNRLELSYLRPSVGRVLR